MGAFVSHTPVQTRFADLDALGHVNNVAFFTFMETARVRYMEALAFPAHVLVARSECDHRREIAASVRCVDVAVHCSSVGRSSFVLQHDLTVDGVEVAAGRVVLVKVGSDGRPEALTEGERVLLLGE